MLTDNKLRNIATAVAISFNTNFLVAYFTHSRLFHNNSVVSLVFLMGRLIKKTTSLKGKVNKGRYSS